MNDRDIIFRDGTGRDGTGRDGTGKRLSFFIRLSLELHPEKVEIRKIRQGIDFLGYVALPHIAVVRTKTKKRIIRKIERAHQSMKKGELEYDAFDSVVTSYLGVLSHSKSKKLSAKIIHNHFGDVTEMV